MVQTHAYSVILNKVKNQTAFSLSRFSRNILQLLLSLQPPSVLGQIPSKYPASGYQHM